MIFDQITESTEDVEDVVVAGLEGEKSDEELAAEIQQNMLAAAMESCMFFENGEEAVKNFTESAEVVALVEARKMSKKTFVRLGKNDDLKRRKNMACLILARENKDPLFTQLAQNRVRERKLRNAIYSRYKNKADKLAKLSQKEHIKQMRTMKALPAIKLN